MDANDPMHAAYRGSPAATASAERPRRLELALVLLLTLLALGIRVRGLSYLLPLSPISDSTTVMQQIDALRGKSWSDPVQARDAAYPPLLAQLTTLLPEPPDVPPEASPSLAAHLELAARPWLQVRIVAVLLAVLYVPLTWLLGRTLFGRTEGLVAAAFATTSLLHVTFTPLEKVHGPQTTFLLLAVLAAIRLRRRGDVASYWLAGAAVALAIAALHSGIAALLVLPAAVFLHRRGPGSASPFWILAPIALATAALVISYPGLVESSVQSFRMLDVGTRQMLQIPGGHRVATDVFHGKSLGPVIGGLWSYDPLLLFAVALGLGAALVAILKKTPVLDADRRRDLLVALAFALPYFLVICLYDISPERFTLPLLPFLAVLGAFGLVRVLAAVFGRGTDGGRASPLVLSLSMVPAALAIVPAWKLGDIRRAPDTLACAARYLEEHARPDVDRILIPSAVDLPLLHSDAALAENAKYPLRSYWVRYQMRLRPDQFVGPRFAILIAPGPTPEVGEALRTDPLAYFRKHDSRFVVLTLGPEKESIRRALQAGAEFACRITPEARDPGRSTNFTYMHSRNPDPWGDPFFAAVMGTARLGNTLEIYRMR